VAQSAASRTTSKGSLRHGTNLDGQPRTHGPWTVRTIGRPKATTSARSSSVQPYLPSGIELLGHPVQVLAAMHAQVGAFGSTAAAAHWCSHSCLVARVSAGSRSRCRRRRTIFPVAHLRAMVPGQRQTVVVVALHGWLEKTATALVGLLNNLLQLPKIRRRELVHRLATAHIERGPH